MEKFKNHRIVNAFGEYDSSIEYKRHLFLMDAEREGRIRNLKRQVAYTLLPAQYKPKYSVLKTKIRRDPDRCAERPCTYIADFTYDKLEEVFVEYDSGMIKRELKWVSVVEDIKGASGKGGKFFSTATDSFRIKKKLMLYIHDIEVKVVTKATEEL